MEDKPLISVVMPAYNEEASIGNSIESILTQTFKNFELIIIDDCSTDKTVKKIKEHKDYRIKLIELKKNGGNPNAINIGIKKANGKYIARIDADDVMVKDRLEKQLNFFEKHDYGLISSRAYKINEAGENIGIIGAALRDSEIKVSLIYGSPIIHPTVFALKELMVKNPYNPKYRRGADFELWTRLKKKTNFGVMPDILVYYQDKKTRSKYKLMDEVLKRQEHEKNILHIFRKYGFFGLKRYIKILMIKLIRGQKE